MYKLKDETNIREIVKKISKYNNLNESNVQALLTYNASSEISDFFGTNLSSLDALLSGEANFALHDKIDLNQADLDNLISEYGESVIIGIFIGYFLKK